MKIRAKLKDVVILPEEGNEYETQEIIRITSMVKDDPEAMIHIDGQIHTGFMGAMPSQFYLSCIKTIGIAKEDWKNLD